MGGCVIACFFLLMVLHILNGFMHRSLQLYVSVLSNDNSN